MKKINISYIIFAVLLLITSSCNKQLNIDPELYMDSDNAMNSSQNIQSALTGAYYTYRGEEGYLHGLNLNLFNELLATTGDLNWIGTWTYVNQFPNKRMTTDNTYVENTWIGSYQTINILNNILDHIEIVDDANRDRVKGEALCMRASIYFELVRQYGKQYNANQGNTQLGVSLILTPTKIADDAEFVPRSSVEEVYTQVIADLTAAKSLLVSMGTNGSNLSTYAAAAFLSRVYLQQSEYEKAALEADYVINSGAYSLTPTPLEAFNNETNSTEDIFALQLNLTSSFYGLAGIYASLLGTGRGDMVINPSFLTNFDLGDLRGEFDENLSSSATIADVGTMFYRGIGKTSNNGDINTAKYGNLYNNIPVIRLAEIYLTRAEGNFEAGTSHGDTPLNDINFVRSRANAPQYTSINTEKIRQERLLELAFEGFKLQDIKRWGLNIGDLSYDDNRLVLPIPLREIEASSYQLQQNEGYY